MSQDSHDHDGSGASDMEPHLDPEDRAIGTIASSESHPDYAVAVFDEGSRRAPPTKLDYSLGSFVYALETVAGTPYAVMGAIYDSELHNPEMEASAPSMAQSQRRKLVPQYASTQQRILGVALLGYAEVRSPDGGDPPVNTTAGGTTLTGPAVLENITHQLPPWGLDIEDSVSKLPPAGYRAFHTPPDADPVRLGYYRNLVELAGPLATVLLDTIIDELRAVTDDEHERHLDALADVVEQNAARDQGMIR
jgi:hypothetical protein